MSRTVLLYVLFMPHIHVLYTVYTIHTVHSIYSTCSLFPCSRCWASVHAQGHWSFTCLCTLSHFSDSHSHFCHPPLLTKLQHSLSCQLFIWLFWCVPQYRCLYYWVNISTKMSKNQSNKREIVRLVDFPPSRTLRLHRRGSRSTSKKPSGSTTRDPCKCRGHFWQG